MSLAKRVEDLKDSAVLGRDTTTRLMELYVEEAIPLAERVEVLIEHDKRALTTRVAFHGSDTYKYIAVQHNFDDTALEYRSSIDRMLNKIQEELDKEPEDAQVHTSPKPGAYAPSQWAKKVAAKALRK